MSSTFRQYCQMCVRCLLCIGLWNAPAEPAHAEDAASRPMAFRHLSVREGISQNTVMDVLQDSAGYIWLATENGLDRYDGYSVTSYQPGPASGGNLPSDYIWKIAEDSAGDLWLATDGGGVARWNRQSDRFTRYRYQPSDERSLSSDKIRTLIVAGNRIWVGTIGGGLDELDPQTGRATHFRHDPTNARSLPGNDIFALLSAPDETLWVGTNNGLARLDPVAGTAIRYPMPLDDPAYQHIRALYRTNDGALWVGTAGAGVSRLDPDTGVFKHYRHNPNDSNSLSHDHVRAILQDAAGRIWVGTADGLNLFLPQTSGFRRYEADQRAEGLADDYVMSLHQDRGGVMWVGTRMGGAHMWNAHSWEFGHHRGAWSEHTSITSFASDSAGYWVGTFDSGLFRVDGVTEALVQIDTTSSGLRLNDAHVMSLLIDHAGVLWVGTMNAGVEYLLPGAARFEGYRHDPKDANGLVSDGVMSLFEDSKRRVWIGTYGGGVSMLDATRRKFTSFAHDENNPKSLCGSQGRAFAEDREGRIWIGTESGLCLWDESAGRFERYRHDDQIPTSIAVDSIYALHVDDHGTLWIGTAGGGLDRLMRQAGEPNTIHFKHTSRRDGLVSNMIYGVEPDASGALWLSSNNGLTRFDPDSMQTTNYGRTDGLQGEEYHFNAHHRSRDGRLFFGGANGFNVFYPERLPRNEPAPRTVLTAIEVMNQPLPAAAPLATIDHIDLTYRDNVVSFEFAALDFVEPATNRLAYRLDGFDSDWVVAQNQRRAVYTNLQAGTYTFRARAANREGSWGGEARAITLTVAPAPWATPLAYAGYAMCLALFVGRYLWLQRRRFEGAALYRKNLEAEVDKRTDELKRSHHDLELAYQSKAEFLARMSHEIRSPMNGVMGISELLSRTALDDQQRRFTDTIRSSGEALLRIINDILDYSKLESHKVELELIDSDVEAVIDEILPLFALDCANRGIELVTDLPPGGLPKLRVDASRLRQVLVNLIGNAIKFTQRGYVLVQLTPVHERDGEMRLRFVVSDSGIGIAAENLERIFESFTQADGSTTRRFGGTGLGLTISKQLVELMGGTIHVVSALQEGSSFSFELSLGIVEGGERALADHEPLAGTALIVSGGRMHCEQLRRYLESWGITAYWLPTGAAAIEFVSRQERPTFDFALIDERLADMSGSDVAAKLCEQGHVRAQRILLMHPYGAAAAQRPIVGASTVSVPVRRTELRRALLAMRAAPSESIHGPHSSQHPARAIEGGFDGNVLLVEDNPVNQEVFQGMLTGLGCRVDVAGDGMTAVEMVSRGKYDVILMDYHLPGIDGIEATRRIRALGDALGRTPVVALTANVAPADRAQFLDAGMNDFLAKPCSMQSLAGVLRQWIRVRAVAVEDAPEPAVAHVQFDRDALERIRRIKRANGSSILPHTVDVFLRTSDDSLGEIEAALEAGDGERVRFVAHRLKSGCANLGALSMAKICKDLEELGEHGETQAAQQLLPGLREQRTLTALWLKERADGQA